MVAGQGLGEAEATGHRRPRQAGQQLLQLRWCRQFAKAMQAGADLGLLELTQVPLRRIQGVIAGATGELQLRQLPQGALTQPLRPFTAELGRLPVFVEQGLQAAQVAVQTGPP